MGTAAKSSNWHNVWPKALELAWEDESFRQALLEDADSAMKAYLNVELPATLPSGQEAKVLPKYATEMREGNRPPCLC